MLFSYPYFFNYIYYTCTVLLIRRERRKQKKRWQERCFGSRWLCGNGFITHKEQGCLHDGIAQSPRNWWQQMCLEVEGGSNHLDLLIAVGEAVTSLGALLICGESLEVLML